MKEVPSPTSTSLVAIAQIGKIPRKYNVACWPVFVP